MISGDKFIEMVALEASSLDYKLEKMQGTDKLQIDFGVKKLHEKHLRRLYPAILKEDADIAALIEKVAPGRPCSHKPMKKIIKNIREKANGILVI